MPCSCARSFLPTRGVLSVYCECGSCSLVGYFCLFIFGWRRSPVCPCALCSRDWGVTHLPGVIPIPGGAARPGLVPVFPSHSPGLCHGSASAPLPSARLQPLNGSKTIALRPLQYSWEYSLYWNRALCNFFYFFIFLITRTILSWFNVLVQNQV